MSEEVKKQLKEEKEKLLEEIKKKAKKKKALMNPDENKEYEFFKRKK